MRIQADEEGRKAIQSLCGVVIESIGGRMLGLVNAILTNIQPLADEKSKEEVSVPNGIKKKMGNKVADRPAEDK